MVTVADTTRWLQAYAREIDTHAAELTELDSVIGDADHGSNMSRGMGFVKEALESAEFDSLDLLCKKVGMTLVSRVGGASGALYGTFFLRMAGALGSETDVSPQSLGDALKAGVAGIQERGKAQPGDKTMVDALQPAVTAYAAAVTDGGDLKAALAAAAAAADEGRDATTPMQARKGRASYLGERSIGHQDPGATSAALLIRTAAETLG